MIATVVFFAEEGMLKGVLMGDVRAAAMHEGAREVFVRARAWFKDMELVCGERSSLQEGAKETGSLGRIQGGCWGRRRVARFAFIPESSLCLWYCFSKSGARTRSAGSHVLLLSGLPFHLMRYYNILEHP